MTQPIGDYFVGRASALDLLAICKFDFRRMTYQSGYIDFLGIQRKVSEKRARDIAQYAGTVDAVFPTSIVIAVPEKCVSIENLCEDRLQRLTIVGYEDKDHPELNIALEEVASIIDGQHRLRGVQLSEGTGIELPVAIFIGTDDATDASIFSVVNLAQTKVNKSLVYDLFAVARTRSPEKTCHEVVVALDRMQESPFHDRIKRLGTATEGRFGETLAQATMVLGLLPYITSDALADRDRGKRFGFWEPISGPQARRRIFFEFFRRGQDENILANVLNYFLAVKTRWPTAWESTGRGNMINRTNGYNAFIRFLRPAYLHITTMPRVVRADEFGRVFDKVNLTDAEFNTNRFLPGTSGAKLLYDELIAQSAVAN
ncbi:MAG TPA: DGQHR domain-containing protein [Caulobacteraceae bacterium]